ncbi:MAG: hypothetical protein COY66_05800 [Candidatus Kerfeldbacteria bacterium CG_4_10_14_0_8_um_filter_42_10]|uniref:Peptide deformylase n=1 Tax=Candidatus Kerfeldbacteria bacterium CG_4_10_14_0_8_um_filter_42_10 TaxID=2014248 RepID=A0A2M7RGD2_9BACT|nr:MAG: hypothetical protein COY66_05800 [Candidatus Kerfeldbacteria bacterium CG_4_10_14_0_8_um_filter_42_10]
MSIIDRIINPFKAAPKISLVKPHGKISREVKENDLKRLKEVAQQMVILAGAMVMRKVVVEVYAISHPQVDAKDPMRFFVFCPQSKSIRDRVNEFDRSFVIVNPRIVRSTQVMVEKQEGCVTFLGMANVPVMRHNKIEVEYQQIERNKFSGELSLTGYKHKDFSGIMAQIFQHEIDHFNAIYVHKNWKELNRTYYKI